MEEINYVSFDTAKALAKAGYPQKVRCDRDQVDKYYDSDGKVAWGDYEETERQDYHGGFYMEKTSETPRFACARPTIGDALDWLERRGVGIAARRRRDGRWYPVVEHGPSRFYGNGPLGPGFPSAPHATDAGILDACGMLGRLRNF